MSRPGWITRNSWWLRWVLAVLFAVLVILFFRHLGRGGIWEAGRFAGALGAFSLLLYLDEWTAGRQVERCKNMLDEECDPQKAYLAMKNLAPYRYARRTQARLHLGMAMALYAMGRYEDAETSLLSMRKLPKDYEFTRHGYLANIHERMGMTELAKQETELMRRKCRGMFAYKRRIWLDWAQASLLAAQGSWQEALDLIEQNIAQARSTRSRVEAYALMGKCLTMLGDPLRARLAYEYVVLHGHALAVVKEARCALTKDGGNA